MEKHSGNDPIEEGNAPVPDEALAAPVQPESLVDSLGWEEIDRSIFASIGPESQVYPEAQYTCDPESDALYAQEYQAFLQSCETPSQPPEFRSDASGSQALVEDFNQPTHFLQFPEYYSDPIGIQGIDQYAVAPVYGDYQVDQAGLIQPAPMAPQGERGTDNTPTTHATPPESTPPIRQLDSSASPPPHPRVALLRLDDIAPSRLRLGTPPRPREGAQGTLKKQAEEGAQGVLGTRKRSADEDQDDQDRPTSKIRLA
ncbi:uncharacterized protein PGTG_04822 [Puccinia graminis f. sp. tritici CRL 75-36-700-3]|uniref:Uncharacterized protein n=1 Tax=Puccinia graminis f. sp. tritici (strain CRL 75-36-700-3 / race SCCL) TaxID=418459 RepID=E3K309_PUCGT|nr:uncharacterized protein PGTG_04822 [Puccinia graminis f. sp. tritici CRL 75-36-700-3]EFP78866.1 hypothetical protein PGTG_04822 [Puccinia graminis f. sp. tritici CRL 75-36-700-3]